MDNPNKRTRNATSPLTPGAAVDRILARRATQAARLEAVISGFDAAEREADSNTLLRVPEDVRDAALRMLEAADVATR